MKNESNVYNGIPLENRSDHSADESARPPKLTVALLFEPGYIKAEELLGDMNISRPQLTRDLARVRDILLPFGLKIESKPYYGMTVCGHEDAKRRCIAKLLQENPCLIKQLRTKQAEESETAICAIQGVIIDEAQRFQYHLTDAVLDNLTLHLFVALVRVENNSTVSIDIDSKKRLQGEREMPLATAIVMSIEQKIGVVFTDDEIYYALCHLKGKRIENPQTGLEFDASLQELINDLLARIKHDHKLDFTQDFELQDMLARHLLPLINRMQHGFELKNPLLSEIKANIPDAFDLALTCGEVIYERYGKKLSDHETSYLALHLKVAMRKASPKRGKKILLVCSAGAASSQLLRMDLKQRFEKQIDTIDCCSRLELFDCELSEYDYIFTTVPLKGKFPIPMLNLKLFLDQDEEREIETVLSKKQVNIERYFRRELFIPDLCAETKQDCIQKIIRIINGVTALPDDFYEQVMLRESLSDTQLTENVSLPHPARIITEETIISIALLKRPILWTEKTVRVVVLISFSKGFVVKNEEVIGALIGLITNKNKLKELLKNRSYETLLKLLCE